MCLSRVAGVMTRMEDVTDNPDIAVICCLSGGHNALEPGTGIPLSW
jgi:hypothetical protein